MATRSVNAVGGFVKLIDDLAEWSRRVPGAVSALEAVLEQTGYLAGLRASTDPQDESRVENLAELVAVVREYERDNPEGTPGCVPGAGLAGGGRGPDPGRARGIRRGSGRRRGGGQAAGRGDPDDAAHRQGPGVPGGVPDRHGARDLPAFAFRGGPVGTGGGAPAGLCGPDPGTQAAVPDPLRGAQPVGAEPVQPCQPVHRAKSRRT